MIVDHRFISLEVLSSDMKKIVLIFIVLVIIGSGGYVGYLKFLSSAEDNDSINVYSETRNIDINKDELRCKDCNLIMISLSNVSAEHMSLYGYERVTTPNLDEWAKDAIVFENAFTQSSWTLPVGTSLFTSLYPYTHKILNRFNENILNDNIKTLPEILKDDGYKTAAFTGGLDYGKNFGHLRGFDDFDEASDSMSAIYFDGFRQSLGKADAWIEKNLNNKFFVFIHGYDAHCPFNPPKKFKGIFSSDKINSSNIDITECLRGYEDSENGNYEAYYYRNGQKKIILTQNDINYLKDLYDEEILSVDELVSDFLNNLDNSILDKTVVVVFSDHGEMFAKHGRFGRAGAVRGTLYDDVLHIPLMIKIPEQQGKRLDGLVQVIDVMPTLLNIMNLPVPSMTEGKDMRGLIKKGIPVNDYVFAGAKFGWFQGPASRDLYNTKSINEAIRTKEYKLIREIKYTKEDEFLEYSYELYDLQKDPEEKYNIINQELVAAEGLKRLLKETGVASIEFDNKSSELLSPEVIEEAKKRGYW